MTEPDAQTAPIASGALAMHALKAAGVDHLFTLSGGHIFPLYDGCRQADVALWDFRHEQSATFAAEGLAKLTRTTQVAALTAGPGVTNSVSAVASARFGGSPILVIGGRAPAATWGTGSLQEIDHTAFMGPITKHASTAMTPADVAPTVAEAYRIAGSAHRGPTFVDIPMDVVFSPADRATALAPADPDVHDHDPADVAAIADLLRSATAPVLIGGTDVWLDAAHEAFGRLAETVGAAVIQNGMGRGCMPADHPQVLSRARGAAFKGADLVIVIGTPLDFRLGFGRFGEAQVVHIVDHPDQISTHAPTAATAAGSLGPLLDSLTQQAGGPTGDLAQQRQATLARLRDAEEAKQAEERDLLTADGDGAIHPARVYGALQQVLDRDAVVIGDGGDFVSYAGRFVQSYEPGHWLDPGPYGCLGTGMGYSAAARIAHPDKQVVLMLGDGAAGFSLMDVESLVRQDLPVVMVVGNNGIWALEKYPMQAMYDGWDVAADLQPNLAYDRVVQAMNGAGETVTSPGDIAKAVQRGFDAGVPYLVNVITDPSVAYPAPPPLSELHGLDVPTLHTPRLTLVPLGEQHLDDYARANNDPRVAQWLGGVPDAPTPWQEQREDTWRLIATLLGHWALRGYGQWAVTDRETGRFLGRAGLWNPEGWPGVEVGWMIAPEAQGRGYASEAGRAAIDFAFDHLELDEVISVTVPHNATSRRVMEKVGLTDTGTTVQLRGHEQVLYRITREEWLAQPEGTAADA